MAIKSITIKDWSGHVLANLESDSVIKLGGPVDSYGSALIQAERTYDADGEDKQIIVSSDYWVDIFTEAYRTFIESNESGTGAFLYTINGLKPTEDGAFFIDGSMCTDWKPDGAGILITDHCVPCFTCDNVFRIKREFEYYRILLNAIKDINLYSVSVTNTRKNYLEGKRIEIPASCRSFMEGLSQEKLLNTIDLDSYNLKFGHMLRHYVTTVHMWNYAVSFNNSSTLIDNTPENPSGIVVQTKRAVASCGSNAATAKCKIEISLSGAANASIYVPDPQSGIFPYPPNSANGSDTETTYNLAGNVDYTKTSDSPIRKVFEFNFGTITKPCTLHTSCKFLPFNGYQMLQNGKPITFGFGLASLVVLDSPVVKESEQFTEEEYDKWNITATPLQYNNPTKDNYHSANMYPSEATNTTLTWDIKITWMVQQFGKPHNYVETYKMETPGLRKYVGGFIFGSKFIQEAGDIEV